MRKSVLRGQLGAACERSHALSVSERLRVRRSVRRYETIQEDILHILGLLGWSPALIPATHWSTLDSAKFRQNDSSKLLKLYDSPQLVELVARKYRNDIVPFGYQFPGRPPDV